MYYEIFENLCKENGVKPGTVSRGTGIHTATLTAWKQGKYTPKQDKLQLIANYFGVSLEYLMNGTEKSIEEKYDTEYAKLVSKIRNDTELSKALIKYFDMSDEKKNHIIELINLFSEVPD